MSRNGGYFKTTMNHSINACTTTSSAATHLAIACLHRSKSLGRACDLFDACTNDLKAALRLSGNKELECRHGADLLLSSNILQSIDIDLVERHIGHFGSKRSNLGGDDLAWATPLGIEVNNSLWYCRCKAS
jgi:hypothetical protein